MAAYSEEAQQMDQLAALMQRVTALEEKLEEVEERVPKEALALGVPLVVADRAPLTELVQEPVCRAVPPGDPAALAAAARAVTAVRLA